MPDDAPSAAPIALPRPVPPGALCTDPAAALETDLAGSGVLWWQGRDASRDGWTARLGEVSAFPTDPNTDPVRTARAGTETGLQCTPGLHCGFVAPAIAPESGRTTLAIRWITPPGEDARTLLTLNTGGAARRTDGENYLFLSEADGVLTAKDDAGRVAVTLPCARNSSARLAVVGLDGDRASLFLDGESRAATGTGAILQGAASLFIAARNQRPKLLKTLGGALILDVWVWPGRAGPDPATLTALRRYHLWAGG